MILDTDAGKRKIIINVTIAVLFVLSFIVVIRLYCPSRCRCRPCTFCISDIVLVVFVAFAFAVNAFVVVVVVVIVVSFVGVFVLVFIRSRRHHNRIRRFCLIHRLRYLRRRRRRIHHPHAN